MLIHSNTLGKARCPRGFTWNNQGNYCENTSGGGNKFINPLTLGKARCPRGFTWNNQGNYCENTSGGGNRFFKTKTLSGLGGQILTAAQMSQMSIAAMQNVIADHLRRIAEIEARVEYEKTLMYPWDNATRDLWLEEKINLLANITAIRNWIALPSNQKAKTDGGKYIISERNKYLATLKKLVPGNNSENSSGDPVNDAVDFLTSQYAGIPVWGIIAFGGVAAYMISSNKKKSKPRA